MELLKLGLDDDQAQKLLNMINGPSHTTYSEILSLKKLAEVHDVAGDSYLYEHETGSGSNGRSVDHVFPEENIGYEVTKVTWDTTEHKQLAAMTDYLVEKYRKPNHHTQFSVIGGEPMVDQRRISSAEVTGVTEVHFVPEWLFPRISERIANKARGKAGDLLGFGGEKVLVVDVRGLYFIPKAVVRKLRRRMNGRGSLSKIDGVLLMVTDVDDEDEVGFLPIINEDSPLNANRYDPVSVRTPLIPLGVFCPAIHMDSRADGLSLNKTRDNVYIINDDVVIDYPLVDEWMLVGFLDSKPGALTDVEISVGRAS